MSRPIPPPPRPPPLRVDLPLPPSRYVPGQGVHPLRGGHGGCGLPPEAPPDLAVARGLDLLDHRFPWEAHEALEQAWRAWPATDPRRTGAAGLVKVGACWLKHWMGATRVARHLLVAAERDLRTGIVPHDVRVGRLLAESRAFLDGGPWPGPVGVRPP